MLVHEVELSHADEQLIGVSVGAHHHRRAQVAISQPLQDLLLCILKSKVQVLT